MSVGGGQDDGEPTREQSPPDTFVTPAEPFEETRPWMAPEGPSLTPSAPTSHDLPSAPDLPASLQGHPRYHVLRRLGRGGMGDVFLAEHRLMGRLVALKTMRLGFEDSQALAERFFREIRATAKLTHPNIVVAHDAEATHDYLFLVMEYLEGRDLRTIAKTAGGLDPTTACYLVYQAALALQHAHRRGVIHRDIKPGNLFVVPDDSGAGPGLVKVLDFGLAKVLGETFPGIIGTPAGFAMGTRGFMSPEQSTDARAVGVHADIFSLGRTLYFLLSGRLPYPNGVHSLMAEEAGLDPMIPLDELRPGMPTEVQKVMRRMSARRSEDRFQSCEEVLAALAPLCGMGGAKPREKPRRWWRLWRDSRSK